MAGQGFKFLTVEEHALAGGFGSAVLEFFNDQEIPVQLKRMGVQDEFIEHGNVNEQREEAGLTVEKIVHHVRAMILSSDRKVKRA